MGLTMMCQKKNIKRQKSHNNENRVVKPKKEYDQIGLNQLKTEKLDKVMKLKL